MCPDLFSKNEMIMYLQDLTNKFQSKAGHFLLSSLLKKYIYLVSLYKKEYNFNKIIMRINTKNYNIFIDGFRHFFSDIEIIFNENDVLKSHFFLLKNNN